MKDFEETERVLEEFFSNSGVGLAIFDERLCYRMVNPYLAASNGTSIEAHIGKHVEEILAEVGVKVGLAIKTVFSTEKPVLNCDVCGALPTKPDGGHWLDSFFPISDASGAVKQVGAVVVELPLERALENRPEHIILQSGALRSWKDIARHLGTCVKTVQRWEQTRHLPVHRIMEKKGAVVFAMADEVDLWLRNQASNSQSLPHKVIDDVSRFLQPNGALAQSTKEFTLPAKGRHR